MWPYPWTHVGTPSHLGHMDRVAATMPSQAHAGAAQEAPDIGQWEGQDVPLVRPSSCNVKGGIPSSRRYLPTSSASFSWPLLWLPVAPVACSAPDDPVRGASTAAGPWMLQSGAHGACCLADPGRSSPGRWAATCPQLLHSGGGIPCCLFLPGCSSPGGAVGAGGAPGAAVGAAARLVGLGFQPPVRLGPPPGAGRQGLQPGRRRRSP